MMSRRRYGRVCGDASGDAETGELLRPESELELEANGTLLLPAGVARSEGEKRALPLGVERAEVFDDDGVIAVALLSGVVDGGGEWTELGFPASDGELPGTAAFCVCSADAPLCFCVCFFCADGCSPWCAVWMFVAATVLSADENVTKQ